MKILLAVDGSACSDVAVDEVARRCWPEDSQVRILSVVETPAPLTSEPLAAGAYASYFEETEKAASENAQTVISRAAAKLREGKESGRPQISTDILRGSPKRVIVEEAEKWGADLIVVGSHGYRSWERMLLGSVSQAVAMHAECSVEIVRRKR